MLNWSQPDLAQRSGLTVNPIISFEKGGASKPAARTMRRIVHAFELAGIAFTKNGGVEWQDSLVSILEGDSAVKDMMDDIYHTLKDGGGEVLIAGLSEPEEEDETLTEFVHAHIQRLQDANITEKILVEEGDSNLLAPIEWHRSLAEEDFSAAPHHLYGDKLAIISWEPQQRVTILQDRLMAQTFRAMFYALWKRATPLSNAESAS
ncbi:hypothetical protein [Coralliovum pocilloporae]|uniref:hypothetical protein n=1 Tax=Coralliovum pocilloporae TaxID=3066369 RepID=UPI003306E73F